MKKTLFVISILLFNISTYAQCWKKVATAKDAELSNMSTLAIATDGSLWTWGLNQYGQLGDGTTTAKTLPVQIGSDKSWESVYSIAGTSFGIKADGILWSWGNNAQRLLGDGTTTNKSNEQ
ncbi:RCC1 domain-containing protein [Dyadobacter frigoris]|uniref:Chromosome condensation regulator RCC1 n=1 Tax=Dyadobacter frigoris TaxID=2576211 RepID=A0A4U6CR74_9BACT|nr:RCC1 domain-containing protein [Dyadobacter frigoris]TKT87040.1 hypothetical protein FDK13_30990 [Dyadobacter frigoris]GLU52761.1 hypothetical protein Dfri01_22220 [Dyadobacter frigoris]